MADDVNYQEFLREKNSKIKKVLAIHSTKLN
jgi:hypothetical protein